MSLLKTVFENDATGVLKEIYGGFSQKLGKVPNVMKVHSVSPEFFGRLMGVYQYFMGHPTLDPLLVGLLRVIISNKNQGEYCVAFQSQVARLNGASDEDLEQAKKDVHGLKMDEKRKSLLVFAVRLIQREEQDTKKEIEKLKTLGWTEKEIYELCVVGALQKGFIPMVEGFEVEIDY